jgi:transcriptional regulator with XRE-family HTH domain
MRYLKIEPKSVQLLRERLAITQQELAARVGCSLSAVQFWEAGRSSPRGYRLRKLIEFCPDDETRALFTSAPPVGRPGFEEIPPHKRKLPGQAELEKRYLDPAYLVTLPYETRALYKETVENILHLAAMKMEGNQVAAEGLRLLAETIVQMAGMATEPDAGRGRRAKSGADSLHEPKVRNK